MMLKYKGIAESEVDSFVDEVLVKGQMWAQGEPESLEGSCVFICAHGSRDKWCGVCGPPFRECFNREITQRGQGEQVFVNDCSHIGGHKYAGNVIVFSRDGSGEGSGHRGQMGLTKEIQRKRNPDDKPTGASDLEKPDHDIKSEGKMNATATTNGVSVQEKGIAEVVSRYMLAFSYAAGAVLALLLAEMFAWQIRAKAMAVSLGVHWFCLQVCNFVLGLAFLSVVEKVGVSVVYLEKSDHDKSGGKENATATTNGVSVQEKEVAERQPPTRIGSRDLHKMCGDENEEEGLLQPYAEKKKPKCKWPVWIEDWELGDTLGVVSLGIAILAVY